MVAPRGRTPTAADASGHGSQNIATGTLSNASGDNSLNIATGNDANASGNSSQNIASGLLSNASGNASQNSASGFFSRASGDNSRNIASGSQSNASGNNSLNTALGAGAIATGDGTANTAVGATASATHLNSSAFGAGAATTRDNQMVLGAATNTYTLRGIASSAGRAAQQGPLEIVTTDLNGNLASDGGAFQRQIDALGRRDNQLADGIAIALATQQPIFHSGQTFALRAGFGDFDGTKALGISVGGVVDRGSFGKHSSVTLDGGVGYGLDNGTVASRVGITFGW